MYGVMLSHFDASKSEKRKNEGKITMSEGEEPCRRTKCTRIAQLEWLPRVKFRKNCSICKNSTAALVPPPTMATLIQIFNIKI